MGIINGYRGDGHDEDGDEDGKKYGAHNPSYFAGYKAGWDNALLVNKEARQAQSGTPVGRPQSAPSPALARRKVVSYWMDGELRYCGTDDGRVWLWSFALGKWEPSSWFGFVEIPQD